MSTADDILNAPIHGKPHMGGIKNWHIADIWGQKVVIGEFIDHPELAGKRGHTSHVVSQDGSEIETRNSRYTLVGPAIY